jgi:hypothetical protein
MTNNRHFFLEYLFILEIKVGFSRDGALEGAGYINR